MAVLPAEIPTGLVTGQFYFVNEDNVDADTDPSLTVVAGTVRFTSSAKVLRMPSKKATIIPLVFEGEFNSQGQLVSVGDPTKIGMEIPATDSSVIMPQNFTWRVEFDLIETETNFTVNIPGFDFQVPEGVETDLTLVMPVDTSPGTLTIIGPQGDQGPVGPGSTVPGPATQLSVLDTTTGPETPGATGPAGPKGDPGDMAPTVGPANITGTVTLVNADLPSTRLNTLTGNVTFVLPTPVATPVRSGTITLVLTQDATGGRTITWPAASVLKWPDGIAQQPATAANSVSVIHLLWTGTQWFGLLGGKSFA